VPDRQVLSGWGGTAPSSATLEAVDPTTVAEAIRASDGRGVIARGLGRSYGDAAQNAGGLVVEFGHTSDHIVLDRDTSAVTVSAGVSLDVLMRALIPHGYFVPVTPGTRFVSVGGAIAADIHGKNHHVHGSFGSSVLSLDLVDGTGELHRLDPVSTPRQFWATVGGMGLTGVIVAATISMRRNETSRMKVDTERAANLDELLAIMSATDDDYTYSVAWIDLLTTGRAMGRSVLTRGEHATLDELRPRQRRRPLAFEPAQLVSAPDLIPTSLIGPLSIRAFNEVWFRKAPRVRRGQIASLAGFFHPLDGVGAWNRLYGPRGFVQSQFVVPFGAEDVLRESVDRIASAGHASFLAVLKRFGPGNPGLLSFPIPGWTLALDLPADQGLAPLLDRLDDLVISAGGRIYLAKDSRARPETIAAMYPRLGEFTTVRDEMDPEHRFTSDLARRLNLTTGPR
jgi:decaprenylphospho-beta-D-ribofuranose 2-oxidase